MNDARQVKRSITAEDYPAAVRFRAYCEWHYTEMGWVSSCGGVSGLDKNELSAFQRCGFCGRLLRVEN